jgi:hypothetical protein
MADYVFPQREVTKEATVLLYMPIADPIWKIGGLLSTEMEFHLIHSTNDYMI